MKVEKKYIRISNMQIIYQHFKLTIFIWMCSKKIAEFSYKPTENAPPILHIQLIVN